MTKRGWIYPKPGPPGSPNKPQRKLDLSPRRRTRLRNTGAAESARKLPLTAKPNGDRVTHTSASEYKRSRHHIRSSPCSSDRGRSAKIIASAGPSAHRAGEIFSERIHGEFWCHTRKTACCLHPLIPICQVGLRWLLPTGREYNRRCVRLTGHWMSRSQKSQGKTWSR